MGRPASVAAVLLADCADCIRTSRRRQSQPVPSESLPILPLIGFSRCVSVRGFRRFQTYSSFLDQEQNNRI